MLVERLIVKPLYKRPLDAILATWGLGIVIGQLITLAFGREVQFVEPARGHLVHLLGIDYSAYRLLLVPVAIALCLLLTGLLNGTRFGIRDPRGDHERGRWPADSASIQRLVRFITFTLGAGLGTLAGTLITPLSSVDPNMGVPWLVSAFMLVMVSGAFAAEPG